jgi:phosphatidylcholine synthase
MSHRLIGLSIHFFTASGAALGLAALFCAVDGRFAAMFLWLGAALVVDAVDGTLARRFRVTETAPHIDGAALDLVVDFLTYVVTPLVALWRSGLLPPAYAATACSIICAASSLYFADKRMKTPDLWFRGFPALWNVMTLYLLVLRPAPIVSLAVVAAAAAAMFLPIVFVHPLRVVRLRPVTLAMTGLWGGAAIAAVGQELAQASFAVKATLVAAACYFAILPLFRDRSAAEPRGGLDG